MTLVASVLGVIGIILFLCIHAMLTLWGLYPPDTSASKDADKPDPWRLLKLAASIRDATKQTLEGQKLERRTK